MTDDLETQLRTTLRRAGHDAIGAEADFTDLHRRARRLARRRAASRAVAMSAALAVMGGGALVVAGARPEGASPATAGGPTPATADGPAPATADGPAPASTAAGAVVNLRPAFPPGVCTMSGAHEAAFTVGPEPAGTWAGVVEEVATGARAVVQRADGVGTVGDGMVGTDLGALTSVVGLDAVITDAKATVELADGSRLNVMGGLDATSIRALVEAAALSTDPQRPVVAFAEGAAFRVVAGSARTTWPMALSWCQVGGGLLGVQAVPDDPVTRAAAAIWAGPGRQAFTRVVGATVLTLTAGDDVALLDEVVEASPEQWADLLARTEQAEATGAPSDAGARSVLSIVVGSTPAELLVAAKGDEEAYFLRAEAMEGSFTGTTDAVVEASTVVSQIGPCCRIEGQVVVAGVLGPAVASIAVYADGVAVEAHLHHPGAGDPGPTYLVAPLPAGAVAWSATVTATDGSVVEVPGGPTGPIGG